MQAFSLYRLLKISLKKKWNDIININLTAAFIATKAVWNSMKEHKFGRIINVASAHGLIASPFKSAYVAAKHGVVGFTKVMAMEGGPFGITCKCRLPWICIYPNSGQPNWCTNASAQYES